MSRYDPIKLEKDVQALLAEAFIVAEELIGPSAAFGDIPEWDSLGHMNMLALLEERFGVEIDAEAIAESEKFWAVHALSMAMLTKKEE